jgi:beta-N-acetylhexosaminidase
MTIDVARLVWGALMPGVSTHPVEPWVSAALANGVQSVCLFAEAIGSPERTRETVRALRAISPDLLISTDEEGGEVTRLQTNAGSSFLSPLALGVVDDPAVTRATGRLLGGMLRASGIDWTLAPVADVNVDPRNPVIGVRSFGGDATQAADHVAAFISGVQAVGVIATAKHFPGHGDTHVDSHESLPTVDADLSLLRARELVPFRAAIDVAVASVMTGHLLVSAVDPDAPASLSRAVTTDLLRDELDFAGVIVTDAVEMGAVSGPAREQLPAAVVTALKAGADVVCIGAADQERALEASAAAVFAALAAGDLDVEVLVVAAERRSALMAGRDHELADSSVEDDEALVADAAVRSLRVHGNPLVTGRGIDVLRTSAAPGYAAGETRWGVARHLAAFGLDVRIVAAAPQTADRDLVIEVRDAWKRPELILALDEATRLRPDAVIVDFGWPARVLPVSRGSITTHGTGNLSSALAACQLAGRDARELALSILTDARLELT